MDWRMILRSVFVKIVMFTCCLDHSVKKTFSADSPNAKLKGE